MKKHYRHENDCLNCGTELQGKFCHHCGQENLQIKESFGHMVNHAVSDYFHFDHQFFHTLKPLFLKPGKLTNEYMAGRRAQYLHPIKMYIFISLVYFLLLFKSDHKAAAAKVESKRLTTSEKAALKKKIQNEVADNVIGYNPMLSEKEKKEIISDIKKDTDSLAEDKKPAKTVQKNRSGKIEKEVEESDDMNFSDYKSYSEYLAAQKKLPKDERDGIFTRYAIKKNFDWHNKGRSSEEIREVFLESIKHNVPKMMFLVLPIFALLLKITFYRNRKFYVEHLIYTIHLHCYIFLFLTVLMLLQLILPETMTGVLGILKTITFFTIVWYVYRSLRVVYNRSGFRTITKMMGIGFAYTMVISFALVILVALTAATAA